jgi:hypothetical protein
MFTLPGNMCFSSTASFGAGVILTAIGVATVKKARQPSHYFFASIPLLFAAQQMTEGFVWLSFKHPALTSYRDPLAHVFLFFAQVVWPLWAPLAILLLLPKEKRKVIEKIFSLAGAIVSFYLFYCLVFYQIEAIETEHHIFYRRDYPTQFTQVSGAFYLAATLGPPFFSESRRLKVLGLALLGSYISTLILYPNHLISVWCFFAAIVSILVFFVLQQLNDTAKNDLSWKKA